ncbi:MAG TPA: phosphate ABC transporter permease subunit PstC [Candidatus Ratteibacteria bacterium]|nr:phosphate ABC transporter permease subunit PstC [bacterium]HRS06363.1 phosphate ABC transporter permease subunit PstC [Candidatus Ratteibacteria bacterium]
MALKKTSKKQEIKKVFSKDPGPWNFYSRAGNKYFLMDWIFKKILFISGVSIFFLVLMIFIFLVLNSMPSIKEFGFRFFLSKSWDPVFEKFGALPFIAGTIFTSFLALLISLPFSLSISLYLGEFSKSGFFSGFLKNSIELLAGVPSVVYGFFGMFVLIPIVRYLEIKFNIEPYGVGIFTSSIILSIMIIPFSASLGREVIELIPQDIKEAAYSLGSTRYEVIKRVVLPYAKSGITAGILMALGRAFGETMAVTMVIGNSNVMPKGLFSPANTMASLIANEFTEAVSRIHLSSLIEIGLVLFIISAVFSIMGKIFIHKFSITENG